MPLQIRRGTQAEANALMVPPQEGELVYITDSEQLYIGDGTTLLNALAPVTGYTAEDAIDDIGAALTSGVHQNITFTYTEGGAQDLANRIDATVGPNVSFTDITATGNTVLANATINGPLTVTGKLTADFNGTISGDDSTILVDGVDNKINLDGTVKGNIIPNVSEVYDIGGPSLKFKDLYLSGTSLYLGDAQVTATGSTINLPVGSTVGGVSIMSGDEAVITDIQGSVFGDDSSVLVDGVNSSLATSSMSLSGGVISTSISNLEIRSAATLIFSSGISEGLGNPGTVEFPLISVPTTAGSILSAAANFISIISRGTSISTPADIADGDATGTIRFTNIQAGGAESYAFIGTQADPTGTISSTYVPTKIYIATNSATSGGPFNVLSFDTSGRLAINQETAEATLDVNGFAKLAILDTEPASPSDGMIAIADGDSVGGWDPLGLGAPAKQQMVVRLGGAWIAIAQAT